MGKEGVESEERGTEMGKGGCCMDIYGGIAAGGFCGLVFILNHGCKWGYCSYLTHGRLIPSHSWMECVAPFYWLVLQKEKSLCDVG